MEVTIISREYVKPSNPSLVQNMEPYKLCLFDQLTPFTYATAVFFYPNNHNHNHVDVTQTLAHLKRSLSETLNEYYPFSGRLRNNVCVDEFGAGALYLEAKVNCRMVDYFGVNDTELLNEFLVFRPFSKEKETESLPLVAFQVNIFSCGGIGLGISLGHKFSDGATVMYLLMSWAAQFTKTPNKVIRPNLTRASMAFPPKDLPQSHQDLMDEMWFNQGSYITRRFVFNAKAISMLRDQSRSDRVPKPSRNEALTGFIWKHAISASIAVSGTPKLSVAAHAVNMRPRVQKPYSLKNSTGNLFWWGFAAVNPENEKERELDQLVGQLKEVLEGFDNDYIETMQGHEGFATVSELLSQVESMFHMESEKPDIVAFTGWNGMFNDVDFGWGKPYWVGVMGKPGPESRNLVVFVNSQRDRGIEAWITLEEKQMRVLEKDKEFLTYGSLSPGISKL